MMTIANVCVFVMEDSSPDAETIGSGYKFAAFDPKDLKHSFDLMFVGTWKLDGNTHIYPDHYSHGCCRMKSISNGLSSYSQGKSRHGRPQLL
jgi:hypothetical protein